MTSEQTFCLITHRLKLVAKTREEATRGIEALPAEDRAQVSAEWLKLLEQSAPCDLWVHGFRVLQNSTGQVVGACGFTGPPGKDGCVEIAYGINADSRCQGYATEVAGALTDYAFKQASVQTVCAHTLPEANASTRVLIKCGFTKVGEAMDPDAGPVWRWEIQRDAG